MGCKASVPLLASASLAQTFKFVDDDDFVRVVDLADFLGLAGASYMWQLTPVPNAAVPFGA